MWTSGGAILRDLSRAQGGAGRGAHAEMRALRPRDRPPPPPRWLSEEMEEYVLGLVPAPAAPAAPAAACEGGPDLRHIQQMLDMVRKLNIAEEELANDEALIGKLDAYTIEHSRSTKLRGAMLAEPAHAAPPATRAPGAPHQLPEPKKHKIKRRNIAIESILQTLENNKRNDAINCSSKQLPLLTPEELTSTFADNINGTGGTDQTKADTSSYNKIDSNDKVNHWMNQHHLVSPIQRMSQSKSVVREAIRLDPSSMFKKKVKYVTKPLPKVNCEAFKKEKWPANDSASYIPSADASLCYQRYLENNKQLQMRREETSQLAVLITEALERAVQARASGRAALEEAPEPEALEEALEQTALEEVPKTSVLEEATERAALGVASVWPALGETSEWPALRETSEWPALRETSEWPALKAREFATLEEVTEWSALKEVPEQLALEKATEPAALEEVPKLPALKKSTDWAALYEATKRSALEEALERTALKKATERAALDEATKRSALEETPERSALKEATEWSAVEEAPEQSPLEESTAWAAIEEATACVDSCVARALRRAPASARLAARRACASRARCPVCARLTPQPAPAPLE